VDGLARARACRKNYPNVVVPIQTAFGSYAYISEAEKQADYVLQKPSKVRKITEIIDSLLKESGRLAD
jgi:DNA-binding NarL/FixJ family response regulator